MSGRDPAAARWAAIQAVRAVGVAMALAGLAIVAGRTALLADVPDEAGWALLAAGLADLFVVPTLLARRWRSAPPAGGGDARR